MGGEELVEKVNIQRAPQTGVKQCGGKNGCGEMLPFESFNKDASKRDGLQAYCKSCQVALVMRTQRKNPAYIAASKAREEVRAERDRLEASGMKRCVRSGCNTVKPISEFHKDSGRPDGLNSLCKSCNYSRVARWAKENFEWSRLQCGAWRARKIGNRVDDFNWEDLVGYWLANGFRPDQCHLCGEIGEYGGIAGLHIDHVIPIARGGSHSMDNLRPACSSCNHMKHSSTLDEYRDRVVRTASFLLSDN